MTDPIKGLDVVLATDIRAGRETPRRLMMPIPSLPTARIGGPTWPFSEMDITKVDGSGGQLKRDPRIEPKNGDIIRFGNAFDSVFYEVISHDPRMGPTDISAFSEGLERNFSLKQWQEFTNDAEVIKIAGNGTCCWTGDWQGTCLCGSPLGKVVDGTSSLTACYKVLMGTAEGGPLAHVIGKKDDYLMVIVAEQLK